MKRLFFLLNLYIAIGFLICTNQNGLILQIDKSITIPNYNCTLNVDNEKLINMTSQGGQLKIIGTQMLMNQTITIIGFTMVQFENITINTQNSYLNIQSPVKMINVTLLKNCHIQSTSLIIQQCIISNITYHNQSAFTSDINVNGLIIQQSTFYKSSLSSQNCLLQNILINEVNFINSTLGTMTTLSNFTMINSFIIQSILIEADIASEITIQNCHFTLSTFLKASGILYITLINTRLSQSILMELSNEKQIQIIGINFQNVTSDIQIINAISPQVKIFNSTIIKVDCLVLMQLRSDGTLIQGLSVSQFNGKLVSSIQSFILTINQFKITNSTSFDFFEMSGEIFLLSGIFQSNNGQYFSQEGINQLTMQQIQFNDLSNTILLRINSASKIEISNISINNCSSMIFAHFQSVINVKLFNISMNQCDECNFLLLNHTKAEMNAITLNQINNYLGSLIYVEQSSLTLIGLNINSATTNNKGLIIFDMCLNLKLMGLLFTNISCPYCDSVILAQSCESVELNKSIFTNSISQSGFMQVSNTMNFIAYNNTFSNITAGLGSGFTIDNSSIQIYSNQFINLTSEKGGVVYINQSTGLNHYVDLNLYDNCKGKTERYIYLISNQITEPDILTFVAGPVYIIVNNQTLSFDDVLKKKQIIQFDNVKSGQQIYMNISILDGNQSQICYNNGDIQINSTIFPFDQANCQYEIQYTYYQSYPIAEIILVNVEFQTLQFYNDTFKLPINFQMIPCEIGEEWQNNSCLKCPIGSYSLNNYSSCLQCTTSIEECPGGAILKVRSGYWRPNTTTDQIELCYQSIQNCKGGEGNQTCSKGYTGALCSDCDYYGRIWGEQYTLSWNGNCEVCQNDAFNIIKIFSSFVWILVALLISVRGSLKLVRAQLTAHYLRMMGIYFATRSTMIIDQTEILIKLVSSYFQLVSIIQVIEFDFPTPITFLIQVIGNPLSTLGYSIECFLLKSNLDIEIIYLRQFWNIFVSVSIVFVFVFIYFASSLCKKQQNSTTTIFITCLIQVNFYFQGDIIEGLLQLMFCIKASGAYYIQAATSYLCYTEDYYTYLKFFVIPGLIVIGLFSPLFYIIKLYRNQTKLWTCGLRIPYGYLYVEYKDKYYFWEFVCFLIKSIFYLLETLLIQEIKLMFLFAILTLLIYLELLNHHQPYIEKQLTFIDKISTQLAMVTLILSYSQVGLNYIALVYILSILCSILNLIYCGYITTKIAREYISSFQQMHIEMIVNLIIRYPCIKYCVKISKNYQTKRKAGLLWKKARAYVIEFIEKLRLQKSNNNINQDGMSQSSTVRPNTSSTNTSLSLINSMTPQLLKYINRKYKRYNSRITPEPDVETQSHSKINDLSIVVSAYIDPNNSIDTPHKKNTVTTIYQLVNNSNK